VQIRSNHAVRLAAAAGAIVLGGAAPAQAQQPCSALANPTIVVGSNDFAPLLKLLAVKLATESSPATIIVPIDGSLSTSCAGVASVVAGADLGGKVARYYTQTGDGIASNTCTLSPGQTAHVAISDVFYESCSTAPQPKPAEVVDALGPAQEVVFAVPKANTSIQYLTSDEAATIYGCGVSAAAPVANVFSDPSGVFCRDPPDSGAQLAIARSIGLPASMMIPPNCVAYRNEATVATQLIARISNPPDMTIDYTPSKGAIGFLSAVNFDPNRSVVNALAFQAHGQTLAFLPDSGPDTRDRANVRDGHYPIWSYVHLIAKMSGGALSPQASDLIGWITLAKTSPKTDPISIEAQASLIPQCAMKVQRATDGGLLRPYSPPWTCNCEYEAAVTQVLPPKCTFCTSSSMCSGGLTCRQGFCE
jgi:hypothetical protein